MNVKEQIEQLEKIKRKRRQRDFYSQRASEIKELRDELKRLHDLPRGNRAKEAELQSQMDDISAKIDELEKNFLRSV